MNQEAPKRKIQLDYRHLGVRADRVTHRQVEAGSVLQDISKSEFIRRSVGHYFEHITQEKRLTTVQCQN